MANQTLRSTSKNDESATFSVIHEIAQERKKVGQPLDLVNYDESRHVFQRELRLFKTGKILGVFQIEIRIGGKRSS